ncbi:MAG: shikimate dehydrogenase [Dehalococcoidia bacterium]|nr:MAG: shikimate dehydrogenase [Dehalococcoidia bacterium]
MINSETRLIALIGDPVAHSVSPAMHNAAFKALGLNYAYMAFRVATEELGEAIDGIRGMGLRGANITIPHKTTALPILDIIDEQARLIGAVNTIVNDNGLLTGHNTDAPGFLSALRLGGFEPNGKKAVVLGAGGAARAIIFALRDAGAFVSIVNRTLSFAEALAGETGAAAFEMTDSGYLKALDGATLIVNATSVGLSPDDSSSPFPSTLLRPEITVFDTVYRPRQTKLLVEAEAAGCRVIGGLEMLIEQGALSFELWTDKEVPREIMRQAAAEALG